MTDEADASGEQQAVAEHVWLAPGVPPNRSKWTTCLLCGVVRRADGRPDSACRGLVKVELRAGEGTQATVLDHPGVEHDGCPYSAPVLRIEGCGDFWFCDKCGEGDEMYPPPAGRPEPS